MDDFKYFKNAHDFDARLEAIMDSHAVEPQKDLEGTLAEKQSGFQDYINKMSALEEIRAGVASKAKVASAPEHLVAERLREITDARNNTINDFLEAAKLASAGL